MTGKDYEFKCDASVVFSIIVAVLISMGMCIFVNKGETYLKEKRPGFDLVTEFCGEDGKMDWDDYEQVIPKSYNLIKGLIEEYKGD